MSDELEIEYDQFKENVDIDMHFIPANDLLSIHYWQDFQANPSTLVAEFGKDYFKMTQEDLDEFYLWMEQSRNEHKLMSISKPRYNCAEYSNYDHCLYAHQLASSPYCEQFKRWNSCRA